MTLGVRWGAGGFLVLVKRSRKVVPEEFVTLMSWDPINFLSCLVTVAVDLNCLLNCVRVSLLRFLFVTVCPIHLVGVGSNIGCGLVL